MPRSAALRVDQSNVCRDVGVQASNHNADTCLHFPRVDRTVSTTEISAAGSASATADRESMDEAGDCDDGVSEGESTGGSGILPIDDGIDIDSESDLPLLQRLARCDENNYCVSHEDQPWDDTEVSNRSDEDYATSDSDADLTGAVSDSDEEGVSDGSDRGRDDEECASSSEQHEGIPSLRNLHKGINGETFEGGSNNLRFNTKAATSEFYPFETLSHLLLSELVFQYSLSRKQTCGLLRMLRTVYDGRRFDIEDLKGVSGDKFLQRMRKYMPLMEVIKRRVPHSSGCSDRTAEVFDFPANLVLERQLLSSAAMKTCFDNPGGKVMRGEEARSNRLASDHILSGPVRPRGNARRTNMHGELARSSPFFGYDGVLGRETGEKIHVHDLAWCDLDDSGRKACRVMAQYWDEGRGVLMASVRRFRGATEVEGEFRKGVKRNGLLRVWEEEDPASEVNIPSTALLAALDIYTPEEVSNGLHLDGGGRGDGARSRGWESCVGEGFIKKQVQRKRARGSPAASELRFKVTNRPWAKEGTPDQPLFTIHKDSFRHNVKDLPFLSAPIVMYIDAFNAHGMGNKVRVINISRKLRHPVISLEYVGTVCRVIVMSVSASELNFHHLMLSALVQTHRKLCYP